MSQCQTNTYMYFKVKIPINAEKTLLYALQLQISFSSTM